MERLVVVESRVIGQLFQWEAILLAQAGQSLPYLEALKKEEIH